MNCGFVLEDGGSRARRGLSLLHACRVPGRSRCRELCLEWLRGSGCLVLALLGSRRWPRPRFRLRTEGARKLAAQMGLARRIRLLVRTADAVALPMGRQGRRVAPILLNLILLNPGSGRSRRWRG